MELIPIDGEGVALNTPVVLEVKADPALLIRNLRDPTSFEPFSPKSQSRREPRYPCNGIPACTRIGFNLSQSKPAFAGLRNTI